MARIPVPSKVIRGFQYVLENDFTGGLKTEFTGLNFPENACTSTENCTFFHTGAVFRRNGFDQELDNSVQTQDRTNSAISSFIWSNAGGDGNTKLYVKQVGNILSFYNITSASLTAPLSSQRLGATVDISLFQVSSPISVECQYTAGNGYLFVYNSSCNPFYCVYSAGAVTASLIDVQIRDFVGVPETNVPDNLRPFVLTDEHNYNVQNQGWTSANAWSALSSDLIAVLSGGDVLSFPVGIFTVTGVSAGITGISPGQAVNVTSGLAFNGSAIGTITASGAVSSYSGTSLVLNITSTSTIIIAAPYPNSSWGEGTTVTPVITGGQITTWHSAIGNYPSNSDVWWSFKNSSLVFDPATTVANVTLGSGPAPKGAFILDAFTQQRARLSGVSSINDVVTLKRPRTGTWFQGRVWYAGVDDSFSATGDEPFSTWTENIYFSQIVTSASDFGQCYQTNDPTSETLFDLLPSDGGVITIQGSGSIYKLFPITNGLLVFAANGIWFITGSTGIGFTATDYTVSKVSAVQNVAGTSYVDILGYPMFWNEEGIYAVSMDSGQQGLSVNSLTLNTIKQFYDDIPLQSKKFARGAYNPITGQVQWIYRSTNESDVTSRYNFDSALTLSMFTQAFYTWTLPTSGPQIHDVVYVVGPGGISSPLPIFKYLNSVPASGSYAFTFAEERDNINWKDWNSISPTDYNSFFVTGYRLHGDAQRRWQPGYVYVYSDNTQNTSYKIQGKWNYAISGNSGKYSSEQVVVNTVNTNNFSKLHRRHKIRGMGTVLQLQISSVSGKPFHIDGWSLWETQNASV